MTEVNYSVYSMMQTGKPLKSYRKTINAKLLVRVLNSFSGEPEEVILKGPNDRPDAIVDIWEEKQMAFFLRANKVALERGLLLAFEKPGNFEEIILEKFANATDEELTELVNKPFFLFQSELQTITSEAVLGRILTIARELDKSDKWQSHILARLSEVQGSEV